MTGSVLQRRINVIRKITSIKVGPGALNLPANVSKLHLVFAKNNFPGNNSIHRGAKKFWHTFLPQIKYHNPDVPMIVERLEEPTCPATLTIYFKPRVASTTHFNDSTTTEGDTSSKQQITDETTIAKDSKKEILMKGRTHTKILDKFIEVTKAKPVLCSENDLREIQWLERVSENSVKEANIMKIHNEKRKKQEEMLSAAKGITA